MMKCDCFTALVYGLVCLAMAYLASLMGSVLQVPLQCSSGNLIFQPVIVLNADY